jgi:hypothetical protein
MKTPAKPEYQANSQVGQVNPEPRDFEPLLFVPWVLGTVLLSIMFSDRLHLAYLYGWRRVEQEQLRFVERHKDGPWFVSNGDVITRGGFVRLLILLACIVASFFAYSIVRLLLRRSGSGERKVLFKSAAMTPPIIFTLCLGAISPFTITTGLLCLSRQEPFNLFNAVFTGALLVLAGVYGVFGSLLIVRDLAAGPVTTTGPIMSRRTRHFSGGHSGDHTMYFLSVNDEEFEVSGNQYNSVGDGDEISVKYWPTIGTVKSVEPFCPKVAVDPTWLTANVVGLAQAIAEDGAYDRLPILADALEEAGCQNSDILNHCRQSGMHAIGCRVIDLILDKK